MPVAKSRKPAKGKAKAPAKKKGPAKAAKPAGAAKSSTAALVERNPENLLKTVKKLGASGSPRKVLQVPQALMKKAVETMKSQGVGGTVKNLSGTKSTSVRAKKK